MSALFHKNLVINQGATFREVWTWATGEPAVPVNLTGCAARMQIRANLAASTVLDALTTENGGVVLSGASGEIQLHINATKTGRFAWNEAVYDVEIAFPDTTVVRLAEGAVSVNLGVTR